MLESQAEKLPFQLDHKLDSPLVGKAKNDRNLMVYNPKFGRWPRRMPSAGGELQLLRVYVVTMSGRDETWRWTQRLAVEIADQGLGEDPIPALLGRQLLRGCSQFSEEGGDARQGRSRLGC